MQQGPCLRMSVCLGGGGDNMNTGSLRTRSSLPLCRANFKREYTAYVKKKKNGVTLAVGILIDILPLPKGL